MLLLSVWKTKTKKNVYISSNAEIVHGVKKKAGESRRYSRLIFLANRYVIVIYPTFPRLIGRENGVSMPMFTSVADVEPLTSCFSVLSATFP